MACPYCLSEMIYLDTDNLLHCKYCGESFTRLENWVDDCFDDDDYPDDDDDDDDDDDSINF